MVAATKNKRGRPKSIIGQVAKTALCLSNGETERTLQNQMYAQVCIQMCPEILKPFFVTSSGKYQRQGIAEQIGRMREENLASETELLQLAKNCISDYNNGRPVKEIEKLLRAIRIEYKKGGQHGNNSNS